MDFEEARESDEMRQQWSIGELGNEEIILRDSGKLREWRQRFVQIIAHFNGTVIRIE